MNIVLLGASGLIGELLVKACLEESGIEGITVITRRRLTLPSKVDQVILSSFSSNTIENLDLKSDLFISCLGTTIKAAKSKEQFFEVDYRYNLAFAKLALKSKGKKFFIISSLGANSNSFLFYNKTKGQLEDSLKEMNFSLLRIFRPSLLIGQRRERRILEGFSISCYQLLVQFISPKSLSHIGTRAQSLVRKIIEESIHADVQKRIKIITAFED